MEIAGCSDHDLQKDEHDYNKTGAVKKTLDAQNTGIEHSDKNIEGGKRLLKCSTDKSIEGNIITLDQKIRKDNDQEKHIALKTHSVFGKLLEKKRRAFEKKKMKQNRKRNQKHVDDLCRRSSGAREGNHENLKKKKMKSRSKDCSGKKRKFEIMKMIGL